jgi:hypothetical protein
MFTITLPAGGVLEIVGFWWALARAEDASAAYPGMPRAGIPGHFVDHTSLWDAVDRYGPPTKVVLASGAELFVNARRNAITGVTNSISIGTAVETDHIIAQRPIGVLTAAGSIRPAYTKDAS